MKQSGAEITSRTIHYILEDVAIPIATEALCPVITLIHKKAWVAIIVEGASTGPLTRGFFKLLTIGLNKRTE